MVVRLPRFRCPGCSRGETGVSWPAHCRSTPALDQLQARLSALTTYRVAAGVLAHLLPVAATTSHETLRSRTLAIGERLRDADTVKPVPPASAITLSLASTFVRSCHEGERHLEVRVGNPEMPDGGRQVFGAVAKMSTPAEPIAISFVESAVDEIIAWRMAKAQQMRWSRATVQPFLDVRTAVLNDTLKDAFCRRHPGFRPANGNQRPIAAAA